MVKGIGYKNYVNQKRLGDNGERRAKIDGEVERCQKNYKKSVALSLDIPQNSLEFDGKFQKLKQ